MDLTSLTGLDSLEDSAETVVKTVEVHDGKPVEIDVGDIIPSKTNPRDKIDPDYIGRLALSIKAKGVKQPISVKSKDEDGKYEINFGECRWRASLKAQKKTIPAFIDDTADQLDQLVENIQRQDLTPLQIAKSIQQHVEKGMRKKDIAEQLGMSDSWVSNHLRLLKLPDCVNTLLSNGLCVDVTALVNLAGAHNSFPEQVEQFCSTSQDFTQKAVKAFVGLLKNPVKPDEGKANDVAKVESTNSEVQEAFAMDNEATQTANNGTPQLPAVDNGPDQVAVASNDPEQPLQTEQTAGKPAEKKPRVVGFEIKHDGRPARLMLKAPTTYGLAFIKYEDDGNEVEIEVGTIEQFVAVATE